MSFSFSCVLSQVDSLVEACRAVRPNSVDGPRDTPEHRDVEVITRERTDRLHCGEAFDPASQEARNLAAIDHPRTRRGDNEEHADATDTDGLTVGQASTRLDVTVRTLHHWDEIGLARPSLRTAAGYRLLHRW